MATQWSCKLLLGLSIPILLVLLQDTNSAKILMMPFNFPSHVWEHCHMGEALVDDGHEVYMVVSLRFPSMEKLKKSRITIITHEIPGPDLFTISPERLAKNFEIQTSSREIDNQRRFDVELTGSCYNSLGDQTLYETLKNHNFDLAVHDIFLAGRCLLIHSYRLGLPYVGVTTIYEPWVLRNPALPSFVTMNIKSHPAYSDRMTFWDRLDNLLTFIEWTAWPGVGYLRDDLVHRYAPEMPPTTLNELASRTKMWLIASDFALDYPRPMAPNEVMVGGTSASDAKPLSDPDLSKFVAGAQEGLVVVSFGSFNLFPSVDILQKLMKAFSKMPQRFVWRQESHPSVQVAPNVLLQNWLPQNDLLGHNNTRLFITHAGGGGQFEALHHAVPMVQFPLFGDQPYNARRVEERGYGVTLYINDFTTDELVQAMKQVLEDPKYLAAITKGSAIFKDQLQKPRDRITYWIEYVLNHGGDHLHSAGLDMPWYQFLMLDILAFVFFLMLACITLAVGTIMCVCKLIGNYRSKSKTE